MMLHYEDLVNERTYRIVFLVDFLPQLIKHGNMIISVKHFEDIRKYFYKEAENIGYKGVECDNYMREFIKKIIGCDYSIDYFKPVGGEATEAGTELCYILKALGETNKSLVNKKNKYIINIDILDENDNLLERPKILAMYRDLVQELKDAVHCNGIDIVGLTDFNYSTIDTGISLNKLGQNHIEYVTDKIADNYNYNLFAINTRLKKKEHIKFWTAYDFIRNAQKDGLIY